MLHYLLYYHFGLNQCPKTIILPLIFLITGPGYMIHCLESPVFLGVRLAQYDHWLGYVQATLPPGSVAL
jgi:hypothetical protein